MRTGILDAFFPNYAVAEARDVGFETWPAEVSDEVALRAALKPQRVAARFTDSLLRRE